MGIPSNRYMYGFACPQALFTCADPGAEERLRSCLGVFSAEAEKLDPQKLPPSGGCKIPAAGAREVAQLVQNKSMRPWFQIPSIHIELWALGLQNHGKPLALLILVSLSFSNRFYLRKIRMIRHSYVLHLACAYHLTSTYCLHRSHTCVYSPHNTKHIHSCPSPHTQ